MSFYNRGYRGFGAFGGVPEAQDALNAANAKVRTLQSQVNVQRNLVTATEKALKNCAEDGGNIVGNILSGGVSAAICMADQNNKLGQRRGILVQYEGDLEAAKAEVQNAQVALTQAKAQAKADAEAIARGEIPASALPTSSTAIAAASGAGGLPSQGLGTLPWIVGGVALLGVGAIFLSRKRS